MMWYGHEEEDEEAGARWRMCAGPVAPYNGSTLTLCLLGILGKPHLAHYIPSQSHRKLMGHQRRKVGHSVKSRIMRNDETNL